jgi:hypothetical protein
VSVNKAYREAWCQAMLLKAIAMVHEARKDPAEAETPLADLARKCANTVFQDNHQTIVGDKEACAKEFMQACREGFAPVIRDVLSKLPAAKQPEEARVM